MRKKRRETRLIETLPSSPSFLVYRTNLDHPSLHAKERERKCRTAEPTRRPDPGLVPVKEDGQVCFVLALCHARDDGGGDGETCTRSDLEGRAVRAEQKRESLCGR